MIERDEATRWLWQEKEKKGTIFHDDDGDGGATKGLYYRVGVGEGGDKEGK